MADEHAGQARELQAIFQTEAEKYHVLPARRPGHRAREPRGRRPTGPGHGKHPAGLRRHGKTHRVPVLNIKNKSHAVTAEVVVPESGAEGVIIAQGGAFAGWSLYLKDNKPRYCYNLLGLQRFTIEGDLPIPAGTHQVRMEFNYDGGGLAKGGTVGSSTSTEPRLERVASTRRYPSSSPATRLPTSAATRPPRSPRTTPARPASSPDGSTGCRSTSARTPRTPTTSSRPRNDSASRWHASSPTPVHSCRAIEADEALETVGG